MEKIMKDINFVKNIDNLGRIVIPMDIRRKLQINTGDVLSITCNDKDILLTKYSSLDNNYKVIEIVKYFMEVLKLNIILMNKEQVIYSNILNIGTKLDGNMQLMVKSGNTLKKEHQSIVFDEKKIEGIYNMLPIITNEGIIGSLIVLGNNESDNLLNCELLNRIICLELNIT